MAHFAKLDENGIVIDILYVDNNDILDGDNNESESVGVTKLTERHGWPHWKKTSYNTRGGKHYSNGVCDVLSDDQTKAFRANYATINGKYDSTNDIFHETQPYGSWTLNTTSGLWEPPTPMPETQTDGIDDEYEWNEDSLSWDKLNS